MMITGDLLISQQGQRRFVLSWLSSLFIDLYIWDPRGAGHPYILVNPLSLSLFIKTHIIRCIQYVQLEQ